jgi:hypothetical protein
MFMFASKQKETPVRVVSSVAYYISIIVEVTFTGVRILFTKCSDIGVSINFHSVVGMVV